MNHWSRRGLRSRPTSTATCAPPSAGSSAPFGRRLLRRPRAPPRRAHRALARARRRAATSASTSREAYGGGRRPGRARDGLRGDRRTRAPRSSSCSSRTAISAAVIAEYGTTEQRKEWLPGLASGREKVVFAITEPDAGSNTHQLCHHRTPRRRRVGARRAQVLHLRCRRRRGAAARRAHRARRPRQRRSSRSSSSPPTRRACRTPAPGRRPAPREAVHAALRRRPAARRGAGRRRGRGRSARCSTGSTRSGSPAPRSVSASPATPCARPPSTPTTAQVWDVPIGAHQGVSHPLAQAKIETELAALMTHKAAWLHDRGLPAGEAVQHGQVRRGRGRARRTGRRDPDPRRQRRRPVSTACCRTGGSPDCSASHR